MPNSKALRISDFVVQLNKLKDRWGDLPMMFEIKNGDILYAVKAEYDCFEDAEGKVVVVELEDDDA